MALGAAVAKLALDDLVAEMALVVAVAKLALFTVMAEMLQCMV